MSPRNCYCSLFRDDPQRRHPARELVEKEGAPLLLDAGVGDLASPPPVAVGLVEKEWALLLVRGARSAGVSRMAS